MRSDARQMFQKNKPFQDRKFLDSLRHKPCLVTNRLGHPDVETVDPAHFRWNTDGGASLKPSDLFAMPLIHSEHIKQGNMGESRYWLEAVNNDPQLLCEFIKDALRWRHLKWRKERGEE